MEERNRGKGRGKKKKVVSSGSMTHLFNCLAWMTVWIDVWMDGHGPNAHKRAQLSS